MLGNKEQKGLQAFVLQSIRIQKAQKFKPKPNASNIFFPASRTRKIVSLMENMCDWIFVGTALLFMLLEAFACLPGEFLLTQKRNSNTEIISYVKPENFVWC